MKKLGLILMTLGFAACGTSKTAQTKDFSGGDMVGNGDPMGVVRGILGIPEVKANMVANVYVQIQPYADAPAELIAVKQISVSGAETKFEVLAPMGLGEQLYVQVEIRDEAKPDGELCYLTTQSNPVWQDSDPTTHRIALTKFSTLCDDDNMTPAAAPIDLSGRHYERAICEQSSDEENCIEFIDFGWSNAVTGLFGGDDIVLSGVVSYSYENLVDITFGNADSFLALIVSPDLKKLYLRENGQVVYYLKE